MQKTDQPRKRRRPPPGAQADHSSPQALNEQRSAENQEWQEKLDQCIATTQRSLTNTVFVLTAELPEEELYIFELGDPTDAIRLFLDVTQGSESWNKPYWVTNAPGDIEQTQDLIVAQNAVMHNLLSDLQAIQGLKFVLAWHVDGEDFSRFDHAGLEHSDAMKKLANRLADELRFLAI